MPQVLWWWNSNEAAHLSQRWATCTGFGPLAHLCSRTAPKWSLTWYGGVVLVVQGGGKLAREVGLSELAVGRTLAGSATACVKNRDAVSNVYVHSFKIKLQQVGRWIYSCISIFFCFYVTWKQMFDQKWFLILHSPLFVLGIRIWKFIVHISTSSLDWRGMCVSLSGM